MITREQIVEAMARAILDERQRAIKERYRLPEPVAGWDGIDDLTQDEIRKEASAALDATLPLLIDRVLENAEDHPFLDTGTEDACEVLASLRAPEQAP